MSESASAISTFLHHVGRRLARVRVAQAVLWILCAGGCAALMAPLGAALVPSMAGPIAALAAFGAAAAVVAFVLVIWFSTRRWSQPAEIAQYVGGAESSVASDLLSSIELNAASHPEFSPELLSALTKSTASRVSSLAPRRLVPLATLKRPALATVAAGSALALTLVLAPNAIARGWSNLAGSTAEIPFDGAAQTQGPVVGDVEISLEFPAYTGRATVTLPAAAGDFRAMPGTIARIRTRSLYRAIGASIVFGESDADDAPSIAMSVERPAEGREVLSAELTIHEASTYRFLIEEPGGAKRVEAKGHSIELEADKAPVVELHTPADVLDVSNTKRVELAYLASDDYGLTKVELVWRSGGAWARLPLPLAEPGRRSAQSKILWDLTEVRLPKGGGSIPYHLEVFDNDAISGPNVGKSKTYTLRVFSPRERHEGLVANQRKLFEKLVGLLGERLIVASEDLEAHRKLHKATLDVVVEIGTLTSALAEDKLASEELRTFLAGLRSRHDKFVAKERTYIDQISSRRNGGRSSERAEQNLGSLDQDQVKALEDDVIALADWIDRQDLEGMLHISDEIKTHRERIDQLMKELARTGDPEIQAEIERELRALEQRLAELGRKGQSMPTDVSDQFVNRDATSIKAEKSCLAEVRELLAAKDSAAAATKMQECGNALEKSAQQMEQALASLRKDRFSPEQKEIAELMSSLADLAQDEDDLAKAIDDVYEDYAEKAAELASKEAKDARGSLAKAARALGKNIGSLNEAALTPFAKEEIESARARVGDLRKMLEDGDLSEALAMSRQAEAALERVTAELEEDIEDGEPWNKNTPRALESTKRAQAMAGKLTDSLRSATPAPKDVIAPGAKRKLDKLLRRQKKLRQRAAQVAKRTGAAKHLPPQVGLKVGEQLGKAGGKMNGVERRLRSVDPSGARHQAHEAADFLRELTRETQKQTRGAESGGRTSMRDEPVRIPGAEEYKAPAELREELLEAMKKGGPSSYDKMLKRYYEELVK